MDKSSYDMFERILRNDLMHALGCTEPIAIALCGAKAREVLGSMPEKATIYCSGNIIKNVKSVIVPNSGGLKGISVALALGMVSGDPSKNLEVLEGLSEQQVQEAIDFLDKDVLYIELAQDDAILFIKTVLTKGDDVVEVEIKNSHTNICSVKKNGKYLKVEDLVESNSKEEIDLDVLSVHSILEFADNVDFDHHPEMLKLLKSQIQYNYAIAKEGLTNDYGASIGKTILETGDNSDPKIMARALAAAGSDARMGGCSMPVVINSGSGNQGMTVSLPVIAYAKHYNLSEDKLLRGLLVSNFIAIHEKRFIGKLSAFCGVVSAGAASGCGIGYLLDMTEDQIANILIITLATTGGMVCDGAKASCASKINIALDNALLAIDMIKKGRTFKSGDGIVGGDVEETIRNIGRMAKEGMKSTDIEILKIMIGQ